MRYTKCALLSVGLASSLVAAQPLIITDDFEAYTPGEFPSSDWLDAAEIPDPPTAPVPSCIVEMTTGPDGLATQVLSAVEAMGRSQGIYRFIPVSGRYIVSADVRIDQLHDFAENETSDWTFEIGVGQFVEGVDLCCTPQVGVYGSCFTGGWRLFAVGTNGAFMDIDLGLPIVLGQWYAVELDLDASRGVLRTRIEDASTGETLVDQTDVLEGWTPADGVYDILNIFEQDFPAKDSTQANLCVVDNVKAVLVGDPCPGDFDGNGEVNTLDVLAFLNAWNAGCP